MKTRKYFVRYGEFANTYSLTYTENDEQTEAAIQAGFERITRREAVRLCRNEIFRRKYDSASSGYADMSIAPYGYEMIEAYLGGNENSVRFSNFDSGDVFVARLRGHIWEREPGDGWHKISGYRVMIENGRVIRGIKGTGNAQVPAYVYRWDHRMHCWTESGGMKVETFRAGAKRGDVTLR